MYRPSGPRQAPGPWRQHPSSFSLLQFIKYFRGAAVVSRDRFASGRLGGGLFGLDLLLLGSISSGSGSRGSIGSRGGLALGLGGIGLGGGTGRGLGLGAVRRRPERQVVPEELHDESAVTVRLLRKRVKLGNSVVKGLLREVASTVGRVEDLVVEDGEVQGQAETDGVGGRQLRLRDIGSALQVARLVQNMK